MYKICLYSVRSFANLVKIQGQKKVFALAKRHLSNKVQFKEVPF